jgi:hypothetical protein
MLYPILLDRISHIFTGRSTPYSVFAIIIAAVVVIKHWGNIKRLMQGKENKFSFKKSVKTEEVAADTKDATEEK